MPPSSFRPITRFYVRQALHGLYQFAQSLKSSLEVILLAAGQVLLMALALLSWPAWQGAIGFAEGWPLPRVLGLLLGYSAFLSSPIFLLRKRLLPAETVHWLRALPITPRARLHAHMAVAGLFILPLGLGFALSSLACLVELPGSHKVIGSALLMMLVALALVLGLGTLILHLRQRALEAQARRTHLSQPLAASALPYRLARPRNRLLQQWYQLFWLPFWRLENGIGLQQCLLFVASLALLVLWLQPAPAFVRFLFCLGASSMVLILSDQGSKAVQEQIWRVRPHLRALPVARLPLEWLARALCLVPAGALLALFALLLWAGSAAPFHPGVARWYLAVQVIGQVLLVALAQVSSAARARVVILLMALLSAIGSELWR